MMRWMAMGFAAMTLGGCVGESAEEREVDGERPGAPPIETPSKVDVWGSALDYGSNNPFLTLGDVEVCVFGETLCTTTTGTGTYEMGGFSPSAHATIAFLKEGYVPAVAESEIGSAGAHADGAMLSVARVAELAAIAGVDAPGNTGGVVVTALGPGYGIAVPFAGLSFSIVEPAPAKSVYVDDLGTPSADQPMTGVLGWGVALGLTPGHHVGTLSHESDDVVCGIASPSGNLAGKDRFEVDVRAGMLTHVVLYCLPDAWM